MQEGDVAHSLVFKGSGTEYAKIYFVNLALTILTLGIYSAWAKVRNKRYFYGNTSIDGSSFDYHASPMQILKGRLLLVGAFIVYIMATKAFPATSLLFVLAFFALLPWAILRSLQFNLQNTSYRQVRFGFSGKMYDMFLYYVLLPIASAFTAFLIYPYAAFQQKNYIANKSRFGQSLFKFDGNSKEFYKIYFTVVAIVILLIIAIFVPIVKTMISSQGALPPSATITKSNPIPMIIAITTIIIYVFIVANTLIGATYIKTRTTNYIYNNLALGEARFGANISFWKLLWIYIGNAFLIMLTLGIYIPWAHVRTVKYKLSCFTLYADDLGGYIAAEASNTKAIGEEFSDVMDIDVGL
jgi:uncharacterized membrane protein YjgN (DUF898 family)